MAETRKIAELDDATNKLKAAQVPTNLATTAQLEALTAGDVGADPAGTAAGLVANLVDDDDPRLTDDRDPTVHGSDKHSVDYATDAELSAHLADTTTVHGIADTSALVLTDDARLTDERTPTDASVTNAKVAAGAAIDLAKLADMTTARILGRVTAGAGGVEQLTAAQVAAFLEAELSGSYAPLDAPSGGIASMPRGDVSASNLAFTSGNLRLAFFTAPVGFTATKVQTSTGTTAAGATPTLCRIGLYTVDGSGDLDLVASTVNDTTLFAGASTSYERSLSSPYAVVAGQRYAIGALVVTGATAPTLVGGNNASFAFEFAESPRLTGVVGSQSDLPASVSAASVNATGIRPYIALKP